MNIVTFGQQGGGKTISAVKDAYWYHKKNPNNKIYTNVAYNRRYFQHNYVEITDMEQIFDIETSCHINLDEAWHLANSTEPTSPENDALSILLIRSRKKNWRCWMSEQWYTQLIKRIRFTVDFWVMPQHYQKFDVIVQDIYNVFAEYIGTKIFKASPYYQLYDSYADPLTLNIEEVRQKYIRRKTRQLKGY